MNTAGMGQSRARPQAITFSPGPLPGSASQGSPTARAWRQGLMALGWVLACAVPAQAQVQRTFLNPSFEDPVIPAAGCRVYINADRVPGWSTTHPLHATESAPSGPPPCSGALDLGTSPGRIIEMWRLPRDILSSAPAGVQIAELNAAQASRLYQSICLISGETVGWRFNHRGRISASTPDVARLVVGSNDTVASVGTTNNGTLSPANTSATLGAITSAATVNAWGAYEGNFTYTGPSGQTNIGFEAVSTATGDATLGNFLDDVRLTLKPIVDFTSAGYSTVEGNDPIPVVRTGGPTLRVNGVVPAGGMTVTVLVTGGTASRGTDYFTNSATGTSDTIAVTIPAGTYDGTSSASLIPLPIYVAGDAANEGSETITLVIQGPAGAPYQVSSNMVCGQAAAPATYTIVDDDGALTVSKTAGVPVAVSGSLTQYDIPYTITVKNDTGFDRTYVLNDTPAFDADVTVNRLVSNTCSRTTATGTTSCGGTLLAASVTSGPWPLNTSHTLASSETETYTIVVRFTINPGRLGADTCGASGSGLFNSVTATVTGQGAGNSTATACQNTPTPVWVSLGKQITSRVNASDQFQVRVYAGGLPLTNGNATTTGGNLTASTASVPIPAGSTLQFFETQTTATGDTLPAQYTASLSCTGSSVTPPGGAGAAQGQQLQWPVFTPAAGDAISCTITNTPRNYTVVATGSIGGSAACTPSPVAAGGSSSCIAAATSGYVFTGWTGNCLGQGASCALTNILSNQVSQALFSPVYTVTATVTGGAPGAQASCTPSPVLSGVTSTCSASTPPAGWSFNGWRGNASCTNSQPSTTCTVAPTSANVQMVAAYTPNPGTLTVSKSVTGGPNPLPTGLSFGFSVSCTGGFSTSGSVAAGGSATVSGIPYGASCTVTETSKSPVTYYTWGTEQITNPTGTMPAGGNLTASISNPLTRNRSDVTITKNLAGAVPVNGVAGSYGFNLACTVDGTPTTFPGTVTLAAGATTGSTVVQVPQGATCTTLTETSQPSAPENRAWDMPVTSPPPSPITGTTAAGSITNTLLAPSLSVTKTNGAASVLAGAGTTYTVTIANASTVPATGVSWSDVPSGLTVSAIAPVLPAGTGSALGSCTASGCSGITVGANGSVSYTVTATVSGATGSSAVNTANVVGAGCTAGAQGGASTPERCTATDTDTIVAPNVTVTKGEPVFASVAGAGGNQYTATYLVTVQNTGTAPGRYTLSDTPAFASGVTLNAWAVVLPTGSGGVVNPGLVTASVGGQVSDANVAIDAGASHPYAVAIAFTTSRAAADLTCTGEARHGAFNTAAITGSSTASSRNCGTLPGALQLSVGKTASVSQAANGSSFSYALTASNAGPVATTNPTTLVDTLPAGLTLTAATAAEGFSCTPSGALPLVGDGATTTLSCTSTAGVAAGATGVAVATLTVTKTSTADVVNTVRVTQGDPACTAQAPADGCSASTTVTDGSAPLLTVTKTNNASTVTAGDTVTYVVTIANTGSAPATGVSWTDTPNANLELSAIAAGSATGEGSAVGSCTASGCSGATVAVGGSVSYTVTATVTGQAGAQAVNTATATSDAPKCPQGGCSATSSDTDPIEAAPAPTPIPTLSQWGLPLLSLLLAGLALRRRRGSF